jgi:hypothetical protein
VVSQPRGAGTRWACGSGIWTRPPIVISPFSCTWHWPIGVLPTLANSSLSCRDGFPGDLVRSAATERTTWTASAGPFWRERECMPVFLCFYFFFFGFPEPCPGLTPPSQGEVGSYVRVRS